MPQQMLRPLKVPKAGSAAKDTDGKEQHQQPVADGLHPAVDGHNGLPDGATPLKVWGDSISSDHISAILLFQTPKALVRVFYDPVVIQVSPPP